jgi:hypothetical protein
MLASLAFPGRASAAVRPLSVEELTVDAKVIVIGKIAAVTSSWNRGRTQILTRVDLQPDDMLKGTPSGDRIAFVYLGGQSGNIGSVIAEAPSFTVGERVVLFLRPRRDGQLGLLALSQGKFSVERDLTSGVDMAVRRVPGSGDVLDQMPLQMLRSRVLVALGK